MGTKNTCQEIIYRVPSMPEIFSETINGGLVEYKIYDIPGLNDGATKSIFYDYINNNFYKFDIIIFNIDIMSGLNTTDELDIINLIKSNINKIKTTYNRDIRLVVICNKCDNLYLNDKKELISSSSEIEDMFSQVKKIIVKNFGESVPILKYSASNTYIYRCAKMKGSDFCPELVDKAYIDRMGIDMFGRISWTRQSDGKTLKELWSLVSKSLSENIEDSLNLSGFNNLRTIFGRNIVHRYFYDIMYSKIHHNENISEFFLKYKFITQLNQKFKCDYGSTLLSKYLIEYLDYIERYYPLGSDRYTKVIHDVQDKAPLLNETDKIKIKRKSDESSKIRYIAKIDAHINSKSLYDKEAIYKIISLLSQLISVTNIDIIDDKLIEGLVRIIHIDDIEKLLTFFHKHSYDKILTKFLKAYLIFSEKQFILGAKNFKNILDKLASFSSLFRPQDEELIKTKSNENTKILCSTKIDYYINGKLTYDIDKIISLLSRLISVTNIDIIDDKLIEGLIRIIHIDDINKLAIFLKSKHLNNDKINIMYFIIIANHINNSVTTNALYKCIKNYILKYYFVTNNELYNKLYAIIYDKVSQPSSLTYTRVIVCCESFDKYKKIIDDFNVFINSVSIFSGLIIKN